MIVQNVKKDYLKMDFYAFRPVLKVNFKNIICVKYANSSVQLVLIKIYALAAL